METRGLEDLPEELSGFYRLRYKHKKLGMMFTTFHPTLNLVETIVNRCVLEGHEIDSLCRITVKRLPSTLEGMVRTAEFQQSNGQQERERKKMEVCNRCGQSPGKCKCWQQKRQQQNDGEK